MLVGLLRGLSPNLDGAETASGDEGEEVGDVWEARKSGLESGGGVTLRVEQARAILFQGKALDDDEQDVSLPGACFRWTKNDCTVNFLLLTCGTYLTL